MASNSNDEKTRGVGGDEGIPVGDSPPMPRWPLIVAAAVWTAWIGFLAVMVIVVQRAAA